MAKLTNISQNEPVRFEDPNEEIDLMIEEKIERLSKEQIEREEEV